MLVLDYYPSWRERERKYFATVWYYVLDQNNSLRHAAGVRGETGGNGGRGARALDDIQELHAHKTMSMSLLQGKEIKNNITTN